VQNALKLSHDGETARVRAALGDSTSDGRFDP
jgi:hypothetical protein